MGQFDLDKYFRDRVEPYSEEMDTDALWEALDMDSREKNRGAFFWLLGFIPVMIIGVIIVYFSGGSVGQLSQASVASDMLENTTQSDKPVDEQYLIIDGNEIDTEKFISEQAQDKYVIQYRDLSMPSSQLTTIKEERGNSNETDNELDKYIFDNSQSRRTALLLPSETDTRNDVLGSDIFDTDKELILIDRYVGKIQLPALESINYLVTAISIPSTLANPTLLQKEESHQKNLSLGLYGGYSRIQRRLSTEFPQFAAPFLDLRNESESLLEATSLGVDLRYKFGFGLYTKLGLEYLSINEIFDWQTQSFEEVETEDLLLSTYVSASGDTTITRVPGTGIRPREETWVNYNNHRMLSIPLTLGYEKTKGPWSFFVEGSFHLNVHYDFNGLQLGYDKVPTKNPRYMAPGLKHSYALSTGIGYQLDAKLSFYLKPHYQSYISSFSRGLEIPVEQRYKLYGIKAAVLYSL